MRSMSNTSDFRPKSRAEQIVEARQGASVEALLRRLYVTEGMTQAEVAATLGVSRDTIGAWMERHGVPTRDQRALAGEAA